MSEEIMDQLCIKFPILNTIKKDLHLDISHEGKLHLTTENTVYELNQQDCLELSQLFALLATAFEEV